jgi:tetratricopeptide (TPR) repeat protein
MSRALPTAPCVHAAAPFLLPLALLLAACQGGTGDFAPGGKAAELLQPVDRATAGAPRAEPETDDDDAPSLPPGHPKISGDGSSDDLLAQVESMKRELQGRAKPLEVLLALGDLYLEKQRYLDAIDWYRQAVTLAEPGFAKLDALPRPPSPGRVPEPVRTACRRGPSRGFDALSAEAEAQARRGAATAAAYCWRQALDPALLARARRGYAFLLAGNPGQAASDEEWVLRRAPDLGEALFFQGGALAELAGEDMSLLRRARDSWQRVLQVEPANPNAQSIQKGIAELETRIRAGGKSPARSPAPANADASARSAPDPGTLSAGATEAIAKLDVSDPEFWKAAEEQLSQGEALLAAGSYDQARENIKGILPVLMMKSNDSPLLPRVLSAMGVAYLQLGNRELGPRMLEMALERDPKNASARAALEAFKQGRPLPRFQPPAPPR